LKEVYYVNIKIGQEIITYFPLAQSFNLLLVFQLNLPFAGPAEFAAGNIRLIREEGTLMGGISVLPVVTYK
jgi:hypothetical protein